MFHFQHSQHIPSIKKMKHSQKLLEPGSVSQSGTARSDFEFPATASGALSNDVVFCGKVITRRTEPDPVPQKTRREGQNPSGKANGFVAGLRSPSGRESRWRKSGSSGRKSYNGMFGTVKFPLQMELSDIKTRQERREPMPMPLPLPKFTAEDGGGESCWELVRPLRRRGTLMRALKASFGCISIV